jgi:hypothetical protein
MKAGMAAVACAAIGDRVRNQTTGSEAWRASPLVGQREMHPFGATECETLGNELTDDERQHGDGDDHNGRPMASL